MFSVPNVVFQGPAPATQEKKAPSAASSAFDADFDDEPVKVSSLPVIKRSSTWPQKEEESVSKVHITREHKPVSVGLRYYHDFLVHICSVHFYYCLLQADIYPSQYIRTLMWLIQGGVDVCHLYVLSRFLFGSSYLGPPHNEIGQHSPMEICSVPQPHFLFKNTDWLRYVWLNKPAVGIRHWPLVLPVLIHEAPILS